MAVTAGQAKAANPEAATHKTTLDNDITMPSKVAPGDGPFDTTDPTEHATSVSPDKGAAALKGFGVVNAVLPLPHPPAGLPPKVERGEDRTETYEVTGPDGKPVTVKHNIDTGETSV
jgi:hypothetical protein